MAIAEGAAIGLVIALFDVNNTDVGGYTIPAYIFSGVVLGVRHGVVAGILAWLPLGGLLYVVHLIAIGLLGYKQPFVERDAEAAAACLWALLPAGLGVAIGVVIRSAWRLVRPSSAGEADS